MEIEKLIKEVFVREQLWNQAHPNHHNRFILEKQWKEIGKNMNTTKDVVKNKWKYLRDTFRKELAKCKQPRFGDLRETAIESRWGYFKLLIFLQDQFTASKSVSNLEAPSYLNEMPVEVCQSQDENEKNIDMKSNLSEHTEQQRFSSEAESDSQLRIDSASTSTFTVNEASQEPKVMLSRRKRKRSPDILREALSLNSGKEKLMLHQDKTSKPSLPMDEDRCFFESILPHVQKMDPIRKLQFRSKIQELILFYTYNYPESSPSSHSTTLTSLDNNTTAT